MRLRPRGRDNSDETERRARDIVRRVEEATRASRVALAHVADALSSCVATAAAAAAPNMIVFGGEGGGVLSLLYSGAVSPARGRGGAWKSAWTKVVMMAFRGAV